MLLFAGIWLLVIGYGLAYVGYSNIQGGHVSFKQAFFPGGLFGLGASTSSTSAGTNATRNPIQSTGGSQVVTV